ncbi:unnamed protein product [Spirodela intermedia]|uniref:Uncharacterized protein n=2 Tax=Spirodela intermedia TaxID=51605 RepID=A0A7I8KA80_SPIIN|nr:unnamed protein product [Spirodela intermedia]
MNSNSGGLPLGLEKAKEAQSEVQRRAAVHAELERVNQLPANSSYAVHRMKVLNKLLHLMSIKRTTTQDEELELLFAGLSL